MAFSLPVSATPFDFHVSDDRYSQFQQLLRLSPIGPLTWENQQDDGQFGVPRKWLEATKSYWLSTFDWGAQERRINSFPNYRITVADVDVDVELHFIALLSVKENATPLVLLHGWPGSFLEFLPMLDLIRKKYHSGTLPFHLIVPSLPGYTLSSGPPPDRAWTAEDAARIINNAMKLLGFHQYVVQGGDVGSLIASLLATKYDSVIGLHCK